jgi:hypothetical protein
LEAKIAFSSHWRCQRGSVSRALYRSEVMKSQGFSWIRGHL